MPDPTPYPVLLADNIARQLGLLAQHLAQAPPEQTAQILGRVLDTDTGVLGQVTALAETGARSTRAHAEQGSFPPELWLALGRAANDLHGLCTDISDHVEDFQRLARPTRAEAAPRPPAPVAAAFVARRRR
ncbi:MULTISPECIES: hypothetical protein [Streptomyces]|uniref:hypothetical protein n=1 Tax=Streptomyces TaxID=1883 RepID=UPI00163C5995|nr:MULTISPECIES: hypothetical protein [Streptomyces]MBC2878056.1 hypothetical protein [Streptomyces sp. TYQ1024]UBI40008.1 hypothetical protein K7I03_28450 [Streptomyces mobaraensis]UKW32589.1 hypothetical protein MCU78_28380 [Streptomyces sp. TYQ1024]